MKVMKTEHDLMMLPDNDMRHELVAGVIVEEPLPMGRHDRLRRRVESLLSGFVTSQRLGEVFGEAGYLLARDPDTVRGPDLSFVARERLVDFDDTRFFRGAPDLAVEILSPSNRRREVESKIADYLNAGCRLVWIIDPKGKTATTYRVLGTPHHVSAESSLDGEDVLPGFAVPLSAIFGR